MIEGNNVEIDAIIEDDSIVLETDLDYRGERGPVGETPDITIGKVDTLSPEDNAYVEKEGTKENITLNFGIPKGETGDIGPVGPTGPSGVYIGSDEPQDPEVDVWIDPTVNPENYVKEKELDDKLNSMIESGELTGPQGPQGIPGKDGIDGKDGVGITTITSGQSTVEDDKTVTPVTVNKTDGSSQIFNVEAKNGIDGKDGLNGKDGVNGQNGQDGITPTIGENGNWYLGDTDTGKPSRGEVGPTPDLTDYVKNTDYANGTTGGTVKSANQFFVTSSNGYVYSGELSKEAYKSIGNASFISKGTLENVKDDYVGSSTPVQDLTATVTNVQNDQDESMPKQTASGEIVSVDDAIAYKTFNVTVDGASEQVVTTGANLLPYPYPSERKEQNGVTFEVNKDGSITLNGTSTGFAAFQIYAGVGLNQALEIPGNYISGGNSKAQIGIYHNINNTDYPQLALNNSGFTEIDKSIYNTGYIEIRVSTGLTFNNETIFPMLSNEANIDWEPYTGGPSPSPDYPQPITTLTFDKITRCGKNLATENFANQNSSINLARTLKKGEKITIVVNMTATDNPPSGYGINIYNQDNEQLWGNSFADWQSSYDGWNSFVVTVKNDTSILRINSYGYQEIEIPTAVLSGALVVENKYVNDGSLYEPYQGQTYDVDLQGNEMVELPNGVKDELVIDKYGNVSLIKNVGKAIYTNMNNFSNNGQNNKRIQYLTPVIENIPLSYGDRLDNIFKSNVISSIYVQDGTSFAGTTATSKIRVSINREFLNIQEESNSGYLNALDELLQSLNESGNPFTIYYPLATPQPISLGKLSDIITTINGTNNISINGNIPTNISTTYALDIKKYIDNKLAEISSALIEEG